MRLGLFGGSFDPVHRAHVALARQAMATLALDRVLWIPAGQPWQKERPMTAATHRLAMLELALQGEPRFVIDEREMRRAGKTFTIDTVRELRAEHPHDALFLLIGRDQYARFHTWVRWREIVAEVTLAVAGRPGPDETVDPEVRACGHVELPMAVMDVSATTVRDRLGRGEPVADLLPDAVASYIEQAGLYRP